VRINQGNLIAMQTTVSLYCSFGRRAFALSLAAVLLLGATACGRKGPLVLPDDMKQPPEQPAAPAK
jgi:predicted small lipoprotein YifL